MKVRCELRIETPVRVERRHQEITNAPIPTRRLGLSRQFKTDAPECRREGSDNLKMVHGVISAKFADFAVAPDQYSRGNELIAIKVTCASIDHDQCVETEAWQDHVHVLPVGEAAWISTSYPTILHAASISSP